MKTTRTADYKRLLNWLKQARRAAGITQEDLARRLGRPQSYVSKCETGERRLDVIEFVDWAAAIRVSPRQVLNKVLKANP